MSFDEAAVDTFFNNMVSRALSLGYFDSVNSSEPKASPGTDIVCAIWIQRIRPYPAGSGLSATTGVVTANNRIYSNMLQDPQDEIDPRIMKATTALLKAYTGDFSFGNTARNVDLLGASGESLSAQAGYINIGNQMCRVMTITVPVIFNDMWNQVT